MPDIAIRAENLSKRYRIGLKEDMHDSLGGSLLDFVARPVKNLRRLRRLSRFSENGRDPDDIIWALKDVSFDVKKGEVVGIIGRNGAGKSTLLKILTRITEPTQGHAEITGRVGSLLEVGTAFHPELTGRENVYLNGAVLGMMRKEIDRKFDEIVDFSGVEKFIDTPVKRFSSGMKVRLAFAVAAHLDPEILLVDEVLAVGDADFQNKCLRRMSSVTAEGRTVLFVSHDMGAIARLCKRVLWIEEGCVKLDGPASTTVRSYLSLTSEQGSTWINSSDSPIGKPVGIMSVHLLSTSDEPIEVIQYDEEFKVRIAYSVREPTKNLSILFRVTDAHGTILWTSWDTDATVWNSGKIHEPGDYASTCTVPGNLLKPGRYLVSVGAFIWREPLDSTYPHTSVLSFDVSQAGYRFSPYDRDGAIAPLFGWRVEHNEHNEG